MAKNKGKQTQQPKAEEVVVNPTNPANSDTEVVGGGTDTQTNTSNDGQHQTEVINPTSLGDLPTGTYTLANDGASNLPSDSESDKNTDGKSSDKDTTKGADGDGNAQSNDEGEQEVPETPTEPVLTDAEKAVATLAEALKRYGKVASKRAVWKKHEGPINQLPFIAIIIGTFVKETNYEIQKAKINYLFKHFDENLKSNDAYLESAFAGRDFDRCQRPADEKELVIRIVNLLNRLADPTTRRMEYKTVDLGWTLNMIASDKVRNNVISIISELCR